jgi:predicted DCC family thiol-disulfide oxidoreductase YuxK
MMMTAPLLLYDGACGFCHASVRWILRRDRDRRLTFAPIQGETAGRLRADHPEIPETMSTLVLIDTDGRAYLRSRAFVRLARYLPRPWRWAHALRFVPAFLLDLGYRLVASLRYRRWGRVDECQLPSPDERARFLP